MSRLTKAFLILLLAALPLRGMTAVVSTLCEPQHHGAGQMIHADCDGCEHDGAHHDQAGDDVDTKCSHCAACSIAAPLVSDSARGTVHAVAGALLVPFRDRSLPGRLPGRLDRPPLPL